MFSRHRKKRKALPVNCTLPALMDHVFADRKPVIGGLDWILTVKSQLWEHEHNAPISIFRELKWIIL